MKQKLFSKKVWIPALVVFLVLQLAAVVGYIYQQQKWEQFIAEQDYLRTVSQNVASQMDKLAYDPQSNRYYLPELRVSFPFERAGQEVMYHEQSRDGDKATVYVTGWPTGNFRSVNTFDQTPCTYDAYLTTLNDQFPEYVLVEDISLENGQTLSLFSNDREDCKQYVDSEQGKELIEYLRQAQSF